MKIMLSQPMKGKTNEEIKKEREHLVKEIESNGDIVLDTIFEEAQKEVDRLNNIPSNKKQAKQWNTRDKFILPSYLERKEEQI